MHSNKGGKPVASPNFILVLIAISAISPLAINIYLPSMLSMARELDVDFATIQLTLSLYYVALAVGQLIAGPLSDAVGRRPVLLTGLLAFLAGSVLCALATSIEALLLGRVLQAVGGCAGLTMSRAIVRDLFQNDRVAAVIGYVTMGMSVAPMVSPAIGGALGEHYGWRASFVFLAALGGLTLFASFYRLAESHRRDPLQATRSFWADNITLLQMRLFWAYTLTTGLISSVFFAFVAGAPYLMTELMGRSPTEYGLYFALVALGYILGNFLTGRLAGHVALHRLIGAGVGTVLLGVAMMGAAFTAGFMHPIALFGPAFLVCLGNGLVVPSGIAGALSVKPEMAGTASGLAGSIQMAFGAGVSFIVSYALDASVWPLIFIMFACAILSVGGLTLVLRK